MSKLFSLVLICASFLSAQEITSDPVSTLAEILAVKGTLTQSEFNRVKTAQLYEQKLSTLAALLKAKGVLSDEEMAKLILPAGSTVNASAGNTQPTSQQIAKSPSSAQQMEAPPVITQTKAPVTLYGTLLLNSFYNTASANIQDVPLFANKQGADANGGDKNFGMTARQSRLGLRYAGPEIGGAKVSGTFEFDLFGGKTALPNGIDMDLFRLRLAYGRVDWQNISLEAGQDWVVFAPLNPTSYAEYAIAPLSASGNLWNRLPQLRLEGKHKVTNSNRLLWQIAALDPNMGDYSTTTFSTQRTPSVGERGRMPSLESRVAWTHIVDDRDFTVGFSGHYGRGKNAGVFNNATIQQPVDSWGAALDYSLPFSRFFALTGEAYEGRALGIYSSAAGEAIGAVRTVGGHGVESRGGWMQGQFNFTKQWQFNLAYGIDAPNASELPVGNRSRNQTYTGNVLYKWRPNVIFGWEYRRLLTDYRNQLFADERGDHANMSVAYQF